MEYQVPQFIEVEDKIVGPLTLAQFIYLAGVAGACVAFFSYLSFIFAALLSLPVAAFGISLAFYKINSKPFIEILEAGFNYYTSKKFMLWKYTAPTTKELGVSAVAAAAADMAAHPKRGAPRLTRGKLSELAWSLDVKSSARPGH
ncbi:MAG: PrgI family protein [Minisyncoccia bacterium]